MAGRSATASRVRVGELAQSSAFALRIDLAASSQSFSLGLEETRIVVGCCSSWAGQGPRFAIFGTPYDRDGYRAHRWSIYGGDVVKRR